MIDVELNLGVCNVVVGRYIKFIILVEMIIKLLLQITIVQPHYLLDTYLDI